MQTSAGGSGTFGRLYLYLKSAVTQAIIRTVIFGRPLKIVAVDWLVSAIAWFCLVIFFCEAFCVSWWLAAKLLILLIIFLL
tara:strand:+ start:71684 stop:71926 length:243 start_codon:yes stop_codon:yes gene_type:complete